MSVLCFPRTAHGRGRTPSVATPLWRVGAPVNAWIAIPNTAGVLGWACDAWGGLAPRDEGYGFVQVGVPAGGGHTNSDDNRFFSIDLSDDAPEWKVRVDASLTKYNAQAGNVATTRTAYYCYDVTPGDNLKPGSSHLYKYLKWCPYSQKYLRIGATGTWSIGDFSQCVDSISPVDIGGGKWQWDAPGTNPLFPYNSNGASQAFGNPTSGWIYCAAYKWRPGEASWTSQSFYNTPYTDKARFPFAYDANRDCIFNLQYGDGQDRGNGGTNDTLLAKQTFINGSKRAITLSSGAALTKFMADKPDYMGMEYNEDDGYFLVMYDRNNSAYGNVQGLFKVTPDPGGTANWTLEEFAVAGGGVTLGRTPTDGSGTNGRLFYSKSLRGWVCMPSSASGMYFMATR